MRRLAVQYNTNGYYKDGNWEIETTTYIGEFYPQIKGLHGFSRLLSFASQLDSLGQGGHFAANQKGGSSIQDLNRLFWESACFQHNIWKILHYKINIQVHLQYAPFPRIKRASRPLRYTWGLLLEGHLRCSEGCQNPLLHSFEDFQMELSNWWSPYKDKLNKDLKDSYMDQMQTFLFFQVLRLG